MILKIEGVSTKADAEKLKGKKAIWTSPKGNKIEGLLTGAHGNSGAIRVRFPDKGLPGQALGQTLDIQ